MNKVLSFIEEMGKNANLKLDRVDFETLFQNDDFDPELKQALINGDESALKMMLDARSKIVCLLVPAKDDDEDSESDNSEETEEETKAINKIA